jgi:hypothetical protein
MKYKVAIHRSEEGISVSVPGSWMKLGFASFARAITS